MIIFKVYIHGNLFFFNTTSTKSTHSFPGKNSNLCRNDFSSISAAGHTVSSCVSGRYSVRIHCKASFLLITQSVSARLFRSIWCRSSGLRFLFPASDFLLVSTSSLDVSVMNPCGWERASPAKTHHQSVLNNFLMYLFQLFRTKRTCGSFTSCVYFM